jgi:membrane peptidoglycan carboxypeptidase
VGYTPTLSTAVWMGNVNSDTTSLGPVKGCLEDGECYTVGQVYGGTWPAITWKEFMQAALAGVPATPFSAPAPIVTPKEAAALRAQTTPTTIGIEPGQPGFVEPTPSGGPYTVPAPTPVAPPPTSSTTTSTTVPKSSTTTTTSVPFSGFGATSGLPP